MPYIPWRCHVVANATQALVGELTTTTLVIGTESGDYELEPPSQVT